MNTELLEALNILEEEKDISKETLLDAIENSLINACKNHFGKADNIKVIMDRENCDYKLIQEKKVVETVEDPVEEISLTNAKMMNPANEIGDTVQIPVESKSFGRIATQNAKNLILQKIREEERKVVYDQYFDDKALEQYRKNHDGAFTLQRYKGLGEMDAQQLWETTLNPETRKLKRIEIEDARMASSVTEMLMGTEVPPRRAFIYENATDAELDV
jgi:hypothetical protein